MKFYSSRIIIAFIAFIVGVCAVWLWLSEPEKQNLEISPIVNTLPQQIQFELEPQIEPKPNQLNPVSINKLRPSGGYWGKDVKQISLQVSQLSENRKLAAIGDSLYMLDNRNRIVWTWTTGGAPLTDFPVTDSHGILYVIAYDLTWVALDSKNGEKFWQRTANGRAVYSQIELYKGDMYLLVTDMTGYRENAYPGDKVIKDKLQLCKGEDTLWDTEIPVGAKIRVRKDKVYAHFQQKNQIFVQEIKIPK